jgi:DNA polymerase-3 subunit beta
VATDSYRLARHRVSGLQVPQGGVIVPTATAQVLLNLLRMTDKVTLTVTAHTVTATSNHWSLTSKLVDGTFPDYRRVLPSRSELPITVDRDELKRAAERITAIASAKRKEARLLLAEGVLTVSGAETDAEVKTVSPVAGGPF